jgi:hypothetical protein
VMTPHDSTRCAEAAMPSDRTDTPSERVEQATRALWFEADFADSRDTLQGAMDELIAAVRAEERALLVGQIEALRNGEVTFAQVLALLSDETPE